MTYYIRLVVICFVAGLFVLGGWYYEPVAVPVVPAIVMTELVLRADVVLASKLAVIEKEAIASYEIYRSYGCPFDLAYRTAERATYFKIPVQIVSAVVIVESKCRSYAVSPAGAVGLMQIMPRQHNTSRSALLDAQTNLNVGIRLLAGLIGKYGIHDGLHHYLGMGVDDGNITGDDYAAKVMKLANSKRTE